jgi:hypothetical protein
LYNAYHKLGECLTFLCIALPALININIILPFILVIRPFFHEITVIHSFVRLFTALHSFVRLFTAIDVWYLQQFTHYFTAIDVWLAACLIFVFAALIEFAFVNVFSRVERRRQSTRRDVTIPQLTNGQNGNEKDLKVKLCLLKCKGFSY